jgi:hypothetical protein
MPVFARAASVRVVTAGDRARPGAGAAGPAAARRAGRRPSGERGELPRWYGERPGILGTLLAGHL